ncbi:MAG: hypothetical protein AB8B91_21165 [Rubripirellula sp.]
MSDESQTESTTVIAEPKKRTRGRLLMLVGLVIGMPVASSMIMWLSWQTPSAQGQDRAGFKRTDVGPASPSDPNGFGQAIRLAQQPTVASGQANSMYYRPVQETSFRDEKYTVTIPYQDPATGTVRSRTETRVRRVPVTTQRWHVQNYSGSLPPGGLPPVNREVAGLLNHLQGASPIADEDEKAAKMDHLRSLLGEEFAEMHHRQAKEIESAKDRLEALIELHDERDQNRERIIQRRMDDLLGKRNALDWQVDSAQATSNSRRVASGLSGSGQASGFPGRTGPPVASPGPPSTRSLQSPTSNFNSPPQQRGGSSTQRQTSPARALRDPENGQSRLPPYQNDVKRSGSRMTEVYDVLEKLTIASGELRLAEAKQKTLQMLRDKGEIPQQELQNSLLATSNTKSQVAFFEKRLKGMQSSLIREIKMAELQLDYERNRLKAMQEGKQSKESIRNGERLLAIAVLGVEEAKGSLASLEEAMVVIAAQKAERSKTSEDAVKGPNSEIRLYGDREIHEELPLNPTPSTDEDKKSETPATDDESPNLFLDLDTSS